ncbi:MAG: hypothetical protein WC273_07620 [Dehalococcoidia bacterium]
MFFASGDQVEITYLEGNTQEQISCTVAQENNGLLKVLWGYDTLVFNMHARTFVRARLIHAAPEAMTPSAVEAWHRDRLDAVHEAFQELDEPAPVHGPAHMAPPTPAWLRSIDPGQSPSAVPGVPIGVEAIATRATLHARWQTYLREARTHLGSAAPFREVARSAALHWQREEAPELTGIGEELLTILRAGRHESVEAEFLRRAESGEILGMRRHGSEQVRYFAPEHIDRLTRQEREQYEPYDPLLARAMRAAALPAGEEMTEAEPE